MKKTVQINIVGVIFSIEEDAYHKLSEYMRSIQQYFASFEGSQEIIQDIESRMAEKFLAYQKEDETKVITLIEVDQLIQSMGTVADFEAIESEDEVTYPNPTTKGNSDHRSGPKRIYRDTQRKAISGVLAGLANYTQVDVTWVRIIFLLLFFGGAPLSEGGLTGILFLAYIICWIAFPANAQLEENRDIKKFYRNPEGQVISGVASGLATYFGLDIAIVRLLFVLGVLFFGTGLMLYIILWIVSPKANSLTQKMELKGEPVTLENIESNVRQTLQGSVSAPENTLTRLVLLPFRALGLFLQALGTVIKRLGPVVRILIGLFLSFLGLVFLFTTLLMTAVFFGLMSASASWMQLPGEAWAVLRELSPWTGFFFFLAAFLPALALAASGIALVLNKSLRHRTVWLSGLGLWIVGVIGLSVIGTTYSLNFAQRNSWEETKTFVNPSSMLYLTVEESDQDNEDMWDQIQIEIEGSSDKTLALETEYAAKGTTREEALRRAREIRYMVLQKDSILQFPNAFGVPVTAPLRDQRVHGTLKIPVGKPFRMSPAFFSNLLSNRWEIRKNHHVEWSTIDKYTFAFSPDKSLTCLDCPELTEEEKEAWDERRDWEEESFDFQTTEDLSAQRQYDVKDFTAISAERYFQVIVKKGDTFSVVGRSGSDKILNNIAVDVQGSTLHLSFEDPFISSRSTQVQFEVTLPTLDGVELSGASQAKVIGFNTLPKLNLVLSGASKAAVSGNIGELSLDLSGASQANFIGQADRLTADISGASRVKGSGFKVKEAVIDASGASQVELGKVARLKQSTSGASNIQTQ